jgi:ABC-type lipoprotein export system ATPase subunit
VGFCLSICCRRHISFILNVVELQFCLTDQRNIGMTMEVDRSSAEQVRAKLQLLKRKQEEGAKEYGGWQMS